MIQQFQISACYECIGQPSNYPPMPQHKVRPRGQRIGQQLFVRELHMVFLRVAARDKSTKRNLRLAQRPTLCAKNGKLDLEHWVCANMAKQPMLRTPIQSQRHLSTYLEYYEEQRIPTRNTIRVRYGQEWSRGLWGYYCRDAPISQDKSRPKNFWPASISMFYPNLQSKSTIGVRRWAFKFPQTALRTVRDSFPSYGSPVFLYVQCLHIIISWN